METWNLVSLLGIPLLLGFGWLVSANRRVVNWRLIGWGTATQLGLATLIFLVPQGRRVFLVLNDVVVAILGCAAAGTSFLFGPLAIPPGQTGPQGEPSPGFILALQGLPTIVFFASLLALLYHLGVMSWLVGLFARVFTRLFRTSGAESLSAASNILVGVESVLTIRPYLEGMTRSELCTVLTAGMATIASSVMALYVFILGPAFPSIAGHLVSASLLSAPAALIFSKLLVPETGVPATLGLDVKPVTDRYASGMDAIIQGAMSGVRLVVGVSALLLALLGLVALVDLGLGFLGGLVNGWFGWSVEWSIRSLAGFVFYPFTLAIGVPPDDARVVSSIIGERVVLTEVASYQDLKAVMESGGLVHARSAVITAYALCGFAHVASLAIFVGGASAVAPSRTAELASVGWRALAAATLACLMTGAVAGAMYTGQHLLVAP